MRNKLQTKFTRVKYLISTKYLLEIIKRRSKVQEKNISCERALNLTNEKHFPKTTSQLEFHYGLLTNLPKIIIQIQKRYLTSLDKIPTLTCHIKLKFFL